MSVKVIHFTKALVFLILRYWSSYKEDKSFDIRNMISLTIRNVINGAERKRSAPINKLNIKQLWGQ